MTISKILLRIALFAYVLSLVLPTVSGGRGLIFAVWGFVAFAMARVWAIVWLANPAFLASAWMIHSGRHPVLRRVLALAGVAFAVYALTIDGHQGAHDGVALQTGYWFWLGSVIVLAGSALLSPAHEEHAEQDHTVVAEEATA